MLYALLDPALAQGIAPPPLSPDARFALALFCAPTCTEDVIDTLDAGLSGVAAREGFPDEARRPLRIMGMAGADFGIPDAAFVALYGVGVDRPEALAASEQVLLAWFASPNGQAVETLSVAHAAFAAAARLGGGWVEDLDTQRLYGAESWAALAPNGPITDWFIVDAEPMTETSTRLRLVTRGLRRYGDFELVVEDVHPDAAGDVSFVLNAIAARLRALGEVPSSISLDQDAVRGSATFRSIARRDTDPEEPLLRATFEGEITLPTPPAAPTPEPPAGGAPVEPPFAVTQVEPPAPAPHTLPHASDADGAPAPVHPPPPFATLDETQALARRRFAEVVIPAWLAGLPSGDAVAAKVPFRTPSGGTEYMWVELRRVAGSELAGVLMNEPAHVSGLRKGDSVTLRLEEVFDYIWKKANGTREGNTTGAYVEQAGGGRP